MDDQTKRKVYISVIVMSIPLMLYQIIFNMGFFGNDSSFIKCLYGVLIGAVIGGVTFGILHFLENR